MKNKILWTAIITPMLENKNIDFDSLNNIIQYQNNMDCGIVLLGSTGEGLSLKLEEKQKIVEFVNRLDLKVPILVGVGGFNLEEQIKWIKFCNTKKIDGYLVVTPMYSKPGPQGQYHWFKKILDFSVKPCMLYNVPSRTGVEIDPSVLNTLKDHDNMWSLKDASGISSKYLEYKKCAPNIFYYSGEDGLVPSFKKQEITGLVSVVSNIWPKQSKKYVEMCLNDEINNNSQEWWKDLASSCFTASNPVPVKKWMAYKKIIKSDMVRPPLSPKDMKGLNDLMKSDSMIKSWYKSLY